MPVASSQKPGSLKDPTVAQLFSTNDPEKRFEDLREIGHGSFGAVFFATDTETNETVAIKKMAFSGKQALEKWQDIIKEVRFLKNIHHQHIVQFRGCYLKEQTCWLIMEYCIGSAADIIEVHRKPLREQEIAAMCEQVLYGLSYLHSLNRIHRDVKAGNILLTDPGVVKLADFGSASLACPAQSFVGTPYWMAPEVILAMDEGQYDDRADIWSLGITCIELAERKPPLFNMNAMSALYHIAQNEAPSLARDPATPWSPRLRTFIESCLKKEPSERMNTARCLEHAFITEPRPVNVLQDLVIRTKAVVRELDNFQYRKMRKLMYLDEQQAGSSSTSELSSLDMEEMDDDLCGGAESTSSRSNSIASYQSSQSAGGLFPGNHSRGGSGAGSLQRRQQRPPIPSHMMPDRNGVDVPDQNHGAGNNGAGNNGAGNNGASNNVTRDDNTTIVSIGDEHDAIASNGPSTTPPLPEQGIPSGHRPPKDEVATLRRSKFSTLRTTKLITREHEEYQRENNMYEQMDGYKRLRQTHQKELKQLEERCAGEVELLRQRLDKEYEQLLQQFQKELQKLHHNHQSELEKKAKANEEMEKKLKKRIVQAQDQDMKNFGNLQKKEYKQNKERAKVELKQRGGSRSAIEAAIRQAKQSMQSQQSEAERRFVREQKTQLELELRRLRRRRILQYHLLEQELLREELNVRSRQLETAHGLLRRHHQQTMEIETGHVNVLQEQKKQHQHSQHESETLNQKQYNNRLNDDLRKRHTLQAKQQPRELKAKEVQIRKQFRQAVKTQTRQYKALQTQLLQTLPKEEHREMVAKLKDEQKRKLALLADQYESTIGSMVQDQTSFDEESTRNGFSLLALSSPSQYASPDATSGSMLSGDGGMASSSSFSSLATTGAP
uniref:non-specific serine/threonine protein kinase n=1 Tax=Plectus sambesii TaxID=2011161 RepID=A0A914WVB1_9BILA